MARHFTLAGADVIMAVNIKDMMAVLSDAVNIRNMTNEDLCDVIGVEKEAYSHPWTLGIFRDCLRVGYRCWVVEIDDKIMGYAVVMIAAGEAHILNICIHPSYQSKGLGRFYLEYLVEQCQQAGADMVLLEVRESNKIATDLYLSSDFHELGTRKDYYPTDGGREDAVILAKYLNQPQQ